MCSRRFIRQQPGRRPTVVYAFIILFGVQSSQHYVSECGILICLLRVSREPWCECLSACMSVYKHRTPLSPFGQLNIIRSTAIRGMLEIVSYRLLVEQEAFTNILPRPLTARFSPSKRHCLVPGMQCRISWTINTMAHVRTRQPQLKRVTYTSMLSRVSRPNVT